MSQVYEVHDHEGGGIRDSKKEGVTCEFEMWDFWKSVTFLFSVHGSPGNASTVVSTFDARAGKEEFNVRFPLI